MEHKHKLVLIMALTTSPILAILILVIIFLCLKNPAKDQTPETEAASEEEKEEDLIKFQGGEGLTVNDILEAPGEVVAKSRYGTLYRANPLRTNSAALVRFLRPASAGKMKELMPLVQLLGSVRHPNLVPLFAFYAGPRGEKLMVHPFYSHATLAQFLTEGNGDSQKWCIMHRISIGIARGLAHLHSGLQHPIIHGNLKSNNILLDRNYDPYVSDFGLHLLLNAPTGQEMLQVSATQGYKAPELIKMKDASEETDVYSFGVILLEMLSREEPINENIPDQNSYLPKSTMRNWRLKHGIMDDLSHPHNFLEEKILKSFQLAVACCSPLPSHRPHIKQVLRKLEEIGD